MGCLLLKNDSKQLEQIIDDELKQVPVLDVHSHLLPEQVMARDLCDILHYHHVGSELISSGLPVEDIWLDGRPHDAGMLDIPRRELVRRALPYLHNIRNTTLGYFLRTILEDLYGVEGGFVDEKNWEEVWDLVEQKAQDPNWEQVVLRDLCHIVRSLIVDRPFNREPNDHFGLTWEWEAFRVLFSPESIQQGVACLEGVLNCELDHRADVEVALKQQIKHCVDHKLHAIVFWLPTSFRLCSPTWDQVKLATERIRENKGSHADAITCGSFILHLFLDCLGQSPLRTVTIIFGADRLPPHRPVSCSSSEAVESLYGLFNQHQNVHFDVFCASDIHTQDFAIAAKHIPNVSIAGYWWHMLYPYYIKKALSTRLDIVPANKIIAFFSDAFHGEWCYPKLKLVKNIFKEILVEKVESGYYTEEAAISLIKQTFFDNPKRIYGVNV